MYKRQGWRFTSDNAEELAECLICADTQTPESRQIMTKMATARLAAFNPDAFARALKISCDYAFKNHKFSLRAWLLAILMEGAT